MGLGGLHRFPALGKAFDTLKPLWKAEELLLLWRHHVTFAEAVWVLHAWHRLHDGCYSLWASSLIPAALIWLSTVTKSLQHLFRSSSILSITPLLKCLFMSFIHFPTGLPHDYYCCILSCISWWKSFCEVFCKHSIAVCFKSFHLKSALLMRSNFFLIFFLSCAMFLELFLLSV